MAQLNPYVLFNGNCREAMTFYQACLGGELIMQTVRASPMADQMPPDMREHILHAMLTNDGFVLMASDMFGTEGVVRGNDVHLCLVCQSQEEIETYFAQLADGGQVGHPLNEEFFGTFGDLTDQFGVRWMLQWSPTPHT